MRPSTKLTLVVSLRINPACEAEFKEFETAAAQIMHRHGGAIERRIRFAAQSAAPLRSGRFFKPQADAPFDVARSRSRKLKHAQNGPPDEIHIVTFPDAASFNRYRADPALETLATLRSRAIRATTVWPGSDLPPFLP